MAAPEGQSAGAYLSSAHRRDFGNQIRQDEVKHEHDRRGLAVEIESAGPPRCGSLSSITTEFRE